MRNEGRNEHEIALRHLDIFLVIPAEIDAGAAGKQVGAGFGLAMMMRQRAEARRIAGLAEPDFGGRRMLRANTRHQLQATGLSGVAVLVALPGDERPVVCSHAGLPLLALPQGSDLRATLRSTDRIGKRRRVPSGQSADQISTVLCWL